MLRRTVDYVLAAGGFSGAGSGTYTIGPSSDGSTVTIKQIPMDCMRSKQGSRKTNSEAWTPDSCIALMVP